jgi:DNA-binding MarR family transcriptional regulator
MKISRLTRYSRAEDILGVLLRRVSGLWRRRLNAELAAIDLTEIQFVLLMAVAWRTEDGQTFTQRDLVEHTNLSRALTSQVLQSLFRKGLVSKRASTDARTPRLTLTAAGERKVRAAVLVVERTEAAFWSEIPEVADKLRDALSGILHHHQGPLEAESAEDEASGLAGRRKGRKSRS